MARYVTGIGSRDLPDWAFNEIEKSCKGLWLENYVLRTGAATGSDQAFLEAFAQTKSRAEVYLPWPSFEKEFMDYISRTNIQLQVYSQAHPDAFAVAAEFHPAWKRLSYGAKMLHARNVHQVMGYDVNNPVFSSLIVCYTENGLEKGGTAQALRIAKHYSIPIINLGTKGSKVKV